MVLRSAQRQLRIASDNAANLMSVDRLAVCGVNGLAGHFATVAEQSQHIDETATMAAKPGAHQFGVVTAGAPRLDRLAERDGLVVGDRRALFGLAQAGAYAADRRPKPAPSAGLQRGREREIGRPAWGDSRMIPKSGDRFSDKIMRKISARR